VRGSPTRLFFKGGQVQSQLVGLQPKDAVQKAIEKSLA
jgi:thioredoxin-like negative regulator of GroEL